MELLRLKYFQTVARLEHMTKAAKELHIAQPALSKMIARLEDDLGVPLFERQGRQIRLNAFGKAFQKKVEIALTALEEGRREVKDLAGLERGRVFLATPNITRFSDLFGSFLFQYPHVNLHLTQISAEEMKIQLLLEGEVDFCITTSPFNEQSGISRLTFLTEEILLAVPPGHRLENRDSINLDEVADDRFISMKENHQFRKTTDLFCQKAGFTPNVVCEVDEYTAIGELVRNGIGIAFMTETAKKKEKSLRLLHIHDFVCQRSFQLIWLEKRYLSLAARTFRDFIVQYFAE